LRFTDERRWSNYVHDYYPIDPKPRFGHDLPPHPEIAKRLDAARGGYEPAMAALAAAHDALHAIGHEARPRHSPITDPTWNNVWFTALDAASLVAFLLAFKPKRYLEIGSGNSTKFARYAIKHGKLPTELISIDPTPRANIDALCTRVIRTTLETCDLAIFDQLESGDILFFDGSHRVFTNSDVTVFFLEIMPRLKPGILVHIHDIFLPDDYPPGWTGRLYSEQYLVAAQLLSFQPPFSIFMPNYFVMLDEKLGARIGELFRSKTGGIDIPARYPNRIECPGTSFWMQTLSPPGA
jgi:hypothetical protein